MAIFYIDGTTLSNSNGVWQDAALTQYANPGYYSDGVIARQLVCNGNSCVLYPPQPCPECAEPCGNQLNASENQGIFRLNIELGGTASDTGAVIIKFDPASVPDGISVQYDGATYNKLSSPQFGWLQAQNSGGTPIQGARTYVGATGSQGNCGPNNQIEGTYSLTEYEYVGGNFNPTGNTISEVITTDNNQLTAGAPGDCVMVIPKPTAQPSLMEMTIVGPCGGTVWSTEVNCPTKIPAMLGVMKTSQTGACVAPFSNTELYYHVPVNNQSTQNNVNLHDYLFTDENGQTAVFDNYYLCPGGFVVHTTNGIVDQKFDTCSTITVQDCTNGQLYTMNDRFSQNVVGDVIQYRRINFSTNTVDPLIYCGTITALGTGTDVNAQQQGAVSYSCGDTTHCP